MPVRGGRRCVPNIGSAPRPVQESENRIMAMRMPRFLKPTDHFTEFHATEATARLHAVGDPAEIIPFPRPSQQSPAIAVVPAKAQLRTRRLSDNRRADEARYETTFTANSGSPIEMLRALASLLETDADMLRPASPGEPVVLDIRLIAG